MELSMRETQKAFENMVAQQDMNSKVEEMLKENSMLYCFLPQNLSIMDLRYIKSIKTLFLFQVKKTNTISFKEI